MLFSDATRPLDGSWLWICSRFWQMRFSWISTRQHIHASWALQLSSSQRPRIQNDSRGLLVGWAGDWKLFCFLRGQNSNSQFILKPADDSYEAWHISQYFEVSCFQRKRTAFGRRRDSNQHKGWDMHFVVVLDWLFLYWPVSRCALTVFNWPRKVKGCG